MNSKSRVRATLEGNIPDRVPIAEYAVDFDTIEKIIGHETYFRAKAKSKIAIWNGHHDEVAESWLNDHLELHQKLDLDVVNLSAAWQIPPETDDPPPRQIDRTTWEDKYGRIFKYSEVTGEICCVSDPVLDAKVYSVEDYQKEPQMPVRDGRSWNIVDTLAQKYKEDKYILGPSGGEVGLALAPGGVTERDMIELIQNPEVAVAAAQYLLKLQNMADEIFIHPDSDAVFWGMDFSFNSGPFISPVMFKEMFLEPFAIRESVESSQIENINTTFETAYKSEYEVKMKPEQKETMAYKEALLHGYEIIKKNGFLSTNHILEIGNILSPSK